MWIYFDYFYRFRKRFRTMFNNSFSFCKVFGIRQKQIHILQRSKPYSMTNLASTCSFPMFVLLLWYGMTDTTSIVLMRKDMQAEQ